MEILMFECLNSQWEADGVQGYISHSIVDWYYEILALFQMFCDFILMYFWLYKIFQFYFHESVFQKIFMVEVKVSV